MCGGSAQEGGINAATIAHSAKTVCFNDPAFRKRGYIERRRERKRFLLLDFPVGGVYLGYICPQPQQEDAAFAGQSH